MPDAHRDFKDRLYAQFARIGKALSSPHRLEILELLAQGERTVDSLATEMGLSLANVSQHLQALRQAALVDSRKDGLFVLYRLSDAAVLRTLCGRPNSRRASTRRPGASGPRALRRSLGRRAGGDGRALEASSIEERRRPRHAATERVRRRSHCGRDLGAGRRAPTTIASAPKGKEYVAYCRGPYCVYADRAVEILRSHGRRARRLREGFPEWRAAGLPVEPPAARSSAGRSAMIFRPYYYFDWAAPPTSSAAARSAKAPSSTRVPTTSTRTLRSRPTRISA